MGTPGHILGMPGHPAQIGKQPGDTVHVTVRERGNADSDRPRRVPPRRLLFTAVRRALQGQTGTELAVVAVVGVRNGWGCGDGGDLADADGAAGHVQPRFSTMMGVISGIWLARNRPSVPYLAVGLQSVRDTAPSGQSPCSSPRRPRSAPRWTGVHRLAHVVGSHHLADFPLVVQDAHLGGVAVGDVADGVGHQGPQGSVLPRYSP